jgi:hypothetical protein
MAAVINRALADLEKDRAAIKTSPRVRDEAMAWINGPECEAYCLAFDADYAVIRGKAAALYRVFLAKTDPVIHAENGIKRAVRCSRSGAQNRAPEGSAIVSYHP